VKNRTRAVCLKYLGRQFHAAGLAGENALSPNSAHQLIDLHIFKTALLVSVLKKKQRKCNQKQERNYF